MNYMMQGYGGGFGGIAPIIFIVFIVWSLVWKGLSLWHSARRQHGWWFVALLIINSLGILDLIYLFLIAKIPSSELIPGKKK